MGVRDILTDSHPVRLCASVFCAYTTRSGCVPSPGVYVGGPAHPLAGALRPLGLCRGLAMRCAHESMRRVPLGAVRQVPGPQGGGGRGKGRRQEAALVSSLSSVANEMGVGGGLGPPFPLLPIGVIYIIIANQKTKITLHHKLML